MTSFAKFHPIMTAECFNTIKNYIANIIVCDNALGFRKKIGSGIEEKKKALHYEAHFRVFSSLRVVSPISFKIILVSIFSLISLHYLALGYFY